MTPEELEQYKTLLMQAGFSEEQLASFGSEQLKAMYEDYAGQEGLVDSQRQQAQALRDATQAGQGGTMAGGRIFVADNPLETLAGIGGDIGNAMKQKKLNERANELSKQKAGGQQNMARLQAMGYGNQMQGDPRAAAMRTGNSDADTWEEERRRLMRGY